MILISHRGNINGVYKDLENTPEYIDMAINKGFDVEIDIWNINKNFYLGHDKPEFLIDLNWIVERKNHIWVHTKNFLSIKYLLDTELRFFFHEKEAHTIIYNTKLIWSHNLQEADSCSIIPLLDKDVLDVYLNKSLINIHVAGICSDYVERIK